MNIVIARTREQAEDSHAMLMLMCREMGYDITPDRDSYIEMVQTHTISFAVVMAYNDDGVAVGQAVLTGCFEPYLPGYTGEMKSLYVNHELRGSGLAGDIVNAVIVEAYRRKYRGLSWYVYKNNMPSIKLFAKMGIEPLPQDDFVEFWRFLN